MATVPLPHLFAVGELVTADNINTYYSGISFLENVPIFDGSQATPQSIPNNAFTSVNIDTTVIDTYNGHSNVTNNSRYTAQVAGWYLPTAGATWATNPTGNRDYAFAKNGTAIGATSAAYPTVASGVPAGAPNSRMVFLNIGDYVEFQVLQSSGGALSLSAAFFDILWVHV
jgi:hypothetical protein